MGAVTSSALRDLIQRGLDTKAWTLADLHRATQRIDSEGRGVAYSSLAAWMNPHTPSGGLPRLRNLDLVAQALGLDAASVRRAAGYRVEEEEALDDPDLEVFASDYRKMSPEARARLMRIVRSVMNDPELFPKNNRGRNNRDR